MRETIIITAADSAYFPLCRSLLASIRGHAEGASVDLGVLDVGLTPEQRRWLEGIGARVAAPDRGVVLPDRPLAGPGLLAMAARVFLPRHFPGHAVYAWIDADAWVQDGAVLGLLTGAARRHGFCLVPELHRAYDYLFTPGLGHPAREMHHLAYTGYFGAATADQLSTLPVANSGVFAGAADAPQWGAWADVMATCALRPMDQFLEQAALNFALAVGAMTAWRLPSTCNWICAHALPMLDGRGRLVEPIEPHGVIEIIHLTTLKDQDAVPVARVEGGSVRMSLGWPGQTPV
ncbi:MAG: hypothetical protein HQL39_09800 [Alphaproteobacteria bacterium]|nr:hypothetical protein [Alphaproteobacteria bacterium]